MIQRLTDPLHHRYTVRVGHHELHVLAVDPTAAVQEARKLLCEQLPRLWDVIQHLESSRFSVSDDHSS